RWFESFLMEGARQIRTFHHPDQPARAMVMKRQRHPMNERNVMNTIRGFHVATGNHKLRRRVLVCALALAAGGLMSGQTWAANDYCEMHSGAAPVLIGNNSFACGPGS